MRITAKCIGLYLKGVYENNCQMYRIVFDIIITAKCIGLDWKGVYENNCQIYWIGLEGRL